VAAPGGPHIEGQYVVSQEQSQTSTCELYSVEPTLQDQYWTSKRRCSGALVCVLVQRSWTSTTQVTRLGAVFNALLVDRCLQHLSTAVYQTEHQSGRVAVQ